MTPTDTHAGDTDDAASVYDAIATFGLTGDADSLPLPESADDIAGLAGRCVAEAFDALIGALHGTGMEGEIEPLAHGLASLINRRWQAHEAALEKERDTLAGIVRTLDRTGAVRIPESLLRLEGTGEVADDMIARITDRTRRLRQRCDVLEEMAGLAARTYAAETGRPFRPAGRPGRSPKPALTGAVFEARELLDAEAKREADRMAVTGSAILVAGDRDWCDHATVWDMLDRSRTALRERRDEGMVLCHTGDRIGVDAIAAAWAKARAVPQVVFRPNWAAHGKKAGFLALDAMLNLEADTKGARPVRGVIGFGGTGKVLNLVQKAEARGLRHVHIRTPKTPAAAAAG